MDHIAPDRPEQAQQAATCMIDLVAGTPVLTLQGVLPVEHLLPDDRLVTRSGALPVKAVAARIVHRPDLLRVSARALGPNQPETDMILAADQDVRLGNPGPVAGTRATPVGLPRLVDGTRIRPEVVAEARMIRLTLPRAAVIYAGGLELAVAPLTVPA